MEANAAQNLTQERWRQIKSIFQAAVELDPSEQDAYLEQACSGDEALRLRVKSLLSSDEQEWELLETPAFEAVAGLLAEDRPALSIGQYLGHYNVLDLLGTGGMGEVYLAHDEMLDRKVALKLLPSEYGSNKERLRRFQQEARAASALNHPNIITIYEVGESDGWYFIASEFINGETLRQCLRREAMSIGKTLDISIQVANALSVAHEAGITHRDIKPENIMLRLDGYVKVLDFGLAKPADQHFGGAGEGDVELAGSTPGLIIGTVKYMSPEQARGLTVDTRSDIFSLGVVMYEMVAGRAPFEGGTNSDLIAAILKDEPISLTHFSPGVPDELQRIITRALRKDREARYQDLRSMLDDLKRLKQELELGFQRPERQSTSNAQAAIHTAGGLAISTGEAGATPTSLGREHYTSQIKRRKIKAAVIFLALLIAVVGIIYVISKRSGNRRAPFQEMRITQIAGTQYSGYGVISPDGEYLAHVTEERGLKGLWIRKVASNDDTQIVPPAQVVYVGLTFSPDGSHVYYASGKSENAPTLYEVPTAGGESKKVLADVAGPITFSPDGGRFAFVRMFGEDGTAIMVANTDGSEERELARRKHPEFFGHAAPAWSPDGRVIACPAGRMAGERFNNVVEVQVENGAETPISSHGWGVVEQVAWLSDGSGLIMIAAEKLLGPWQIWNLSYPEGELRRITNDLNGYARLSITADSKSIVTVRIQMRTSIWQVPGGDARKAEPVTDESDIIIREICWSPDGRIVFPSTASGSREISIINADGTGLKQLTADGYPKFWPSVSHDGRYIVFSSRGADAHHIWRMDADGSNLKQLTSGTGENPFSCSPDGWVIYASGKLWKVPIEGGKPVQLTDKPSNFPKVSPDGKLIACWYKDEAASEWKIAIIPFEGGPPIRTFDIPLNPDFRWMPDGRALNYIATRNGVSNLWSQPIEGGPPRQLTHFNSLMMYGFDWTRDGTLICSRGFGVRDLVLITDFD